MAENLPNLGKETSKIQETQSSKQDESRKIQAKFRSPILESGKLPNRIWGKGSCARLAASSGLWLLEY